MPVTITAFNEDGSMAYTAWPNAVHVDQATITLKGDAINRILIETLAGRTTLYDVCFVCLPKVSGPKPDIEVSAVSENVRVVRAIAQSRPGEVETIPLEFDLITGVEISQGQAVLVDICFVPVEQDATEGWMALEPFTPFPGFPYPMCLPVDDPDYPCQGKPADAAAAKSMAQERIVYEDAKAQADAAFPDLREELKKLVTGGREGEPMADRLEAIGGVAEPPDPDALPPEMPAQSPLDTVLVSALHPAIAQMVGCTGPTRALRPRSPTTT